MDAEGGADQAVLGFSRRCFVHGDDVEAVWRALKVVTRDVCVGRADDARAFFETDGGFRQVRRCSGFHFDKYEDVREEFEAADFVFLLPHQLTLLPEGVVDLFVNISSLHEMNMEQIRHYLAEIYRLVRPGGHFYLKAWKISRNPFEHIEVKEEDYPLDAWTQVFRRTPAVQTRFFETMLRKPSVDRR